MKKLLYLAVAAMAALSSCSNDDIINDNVNDNDNEKANATAFTATIEGESETRTTLADGTGTNKMVNWANGDQISINGSLYSTTSTTNTAGFSLVEGQTAAAAVDGKYYAVYPSTIAFNTSTQTLTLPATQTYDATTNGIGNVPMVAESENTTLQFKNICAVLAIKVTEGTVKAIKVMADKKNLSGDFTLDPSTSDITATTTGTNTVILECGTAVTANNTTFYIAIPPQEYSSLQIYLSADGTTYKEAMATKVAAGLGTLARNKIYPIDYEKNAVQLWAGGPYFATENVGGAQQKYQWGATAADGTANEGDYDLEHDTAYKLWGSAWRMPTQAECAALLDNCNYSFGNGAFGLSSKTSGYGSISFPVEDRGNSYDANYCTSTVHNNGWPYLLNFMVSSGDSQFANASGTSSPADERFVRAVLATPAAAPVPDPNLLKGVFSVSATKKVKFTKGNLWWTGSAYQFEANQTAYLTAWNTSHVGHFFWSNYTDYTRTDEHAHEYKPYYSSFAASSKSTTDVFWCGKDHPLEVAGTQGLYTLSADEWAYLLNPTYNYDSNLRTQTNRFARARVNDTYGYLIFPDGYNGETAVSGIQGIGTVNEDGDSGYPSENIPDATWADMEAAGVVFLPNAGIRKGTDYTSGYGKYWSSTPNGISNAKNVYFDANGIVFCPGNTYRSDGSSIRLVKTVE